MNLNFPHGRCHVRSLSLPILLLSYSNHILLLLNLSLPFISQTKLRVKLPTPSSFSHYPLKLIIYPFFYFINNQTPQYIFFKSILEMPFILNIQHQHRRYEFFLLKNIRLSWIMYFSSNLCIVEKGGIIFFLFYNIVR